MESLSKFSMIFVSASFSAMMLSPVASHAQTDAGQADLGVRKYKNLQELIYAQDGTDLKAFKGDVEINRVSLDDAFLLAYTTAEKKQNTKEGLKALANDRAGKICAAVGRELLSVDVREYFEKNDVLKQDKGLKFTRVAEKGQRVVSGVRQVPNYSQQFLGYSGSVPMWGDEYVSSYTPVTDYDTDYYGLITGMKCKPKAVVEKLNAKGKALKLTTQLASVEPAKSSTSELAKGLPGQSCSDGASVKTDLIKRFAGADNAEKKQISDNIVAFDRRCGENSVQTAAAKPVRR